MHILEIGADQEDDGSSSRGVDAAFRTVAKDHTAFLVWKVSESCTELLPRTHYGTFYDGEAYLVYSCSLPGQPAGPDVIRREIKEKENGNGGEYPERHIHAWAGERCGNLAALAVRRATQLATYLAAPVVIHREAATKETPRLLSYFKDGIRILRSGSGQMNGTGGRLYRVRGRRPVLLQLEPVSWSQLASDGVFVLDTSALLVLWLGRAANLVEKIFGAKFAYRMARGADKGMVARRIAIAHDGYEQTLPAPDRALLDAVLELRARAVRPAAPTPDPPRLARLYRATQPARVAPVTVPSQRAAARLEEIKRAPLYRSDLSDHGVYIVEGGACGVWAWVGPQAPAGAARGALAAARGLARAKRHAGAVAVTTAGHEPLEFAAMFRGWRWCDTRRDSRLRCARSATTKLDAVSLATNAWLAAEAQLPDDGSGSVRAWRVRAASEPAGAPLVELERAPPAFYDADCYLVLYTYHAPTGDNTLLYYWMGGSAPNDLRNLGAREAKDLYIKLGRLPVQAWVYQGKEPAHFLQIFKGRMITYIGRATDHDPTGRRVIPPARALIRVSGQYAREARGVEVRETEPGHGAYVGTNGVNGGLNGVNGGMNGVNGGMNGVNGGMNGVNGGVNGVNGGVNGVNGSKNGVNGGMNGVNGGLNGVNGCNDGEGVGSCYVLREGARTWVWCAATATGDEREVAKNMAAAEHVLVMQGKEKPDFWSALGSRRSLLVAAPLQQVARPLPPRLFYVSLGPHPHYNFEEIVSFTQYDLAPEMAGVVDAHGAVFVWLGAHAPPRARDEPRALALAYLAHDPAGRDPETPIITISQGREPPHFTGFFPHWKHNMWKGHKTFGAIISALEGKAIVKGGNSAIQSGNTANRFDQYEKYPHSVLRGPKEHLPPDVDPLIKELYLTHDDFVATFGVPYSEFRSLPAWKQKELKKTVGLF